MSEFLSTLNDSQRQAVEHINGPLMVIAGAGSGKTRVLTFRIAHLINNGVDPFNILALTFTNKAAKEMKERIESILGGSQARNVWMGTFHSIFAKILRFEAEKINFPRDFTIYDSQDSKNLLRSIIKEKNIDDKIYKVNIVQSRISSAKNNLISPARYMENTTIQSDDREAGRPRLGEIYLEYWNRCYKAGAMDFDDLLFRTNILLRDFPDILHKYQHKFKYILVDEYQDTNHAQYLIVKKLAALNQNVCVVGDDAQSIYAFRGANIENILNFKKDYPDYKLYKLEQNYRSTKAIVQAANSIIKNNQNQIEKNVWTSNPEGNKIKVHKSDTDNLEANYVANEIFDKVNTDQLPYNDFAILYRTNAQSRAMEEALRRLNIPYKIFGGLSFYQRKEVKDLLAYFRLTANHRDEESLKRVINYPKRGIGKTTLDKATIQSAEHDVSLWQVIETPEQYGLQLASGARGKLNDFVLMIKSFAARLANSEAFDIAESIAKESGIMRELYSDKTPEGVSRYDNMQELLNGIKDFTERYKKENQDEAPVLNDFLVDVALLTDADQEDEDPNRVSMMTIHSAKGLEFPYVFIVGMEENLFPSQMSISSRADLEEERRLFYVALTRAEKEAQLTYADTRYRWGQLTYCEVSRFVDEIDEQFIEKPLEYGLSNFASAKPEKSKPSFSSRGSFSNNKAKSQSFTKKSNLAASGIGNKKPLSSAKDKPVDQGADFLKPEEIEVGQNVLHQKFGKGKVVNLEGNMPDVMATIFFPSSGQKKLLLKFAKLTASN